MTLELNEQKNRVRYKSYVAPILPYKVYKNGMNSALIYKTIGKIQSYEVLLN